MMGCVLLLISGASGSGKTSVREAIASELDPSVVTVELRHLGAVPDLPTLEWRQRMAEEAVRRAAQLDEQGRHLLLSGDPVAPGEVLAAPSAPTADIAICLLDVDEPSQRDRLRRRGDPEELLHRHAAFADWLREHARDPRHMPHVLRTDGWPEMQWSRLTNMPVDRWQISTIDGSNMSRAQANQAALQWVTDAIAGRAPVFRRAATSTR
jgi:cytidylate kinase